jgi:hypothetical protein
MREENSMLIGVPSEIKDNEARVGLVPALGPVWPMRITSRPGPK